MKHIPVNFVTNCPQTFLHHDSKNQIGNCKNQLIPGMGKRNGDIFSSVLHDHRGELDISSKDSREPQYLSLNEIIQSSSNNNTFPFVNSKVLIDPGVVYRSEFQKVEGYDAYAKECGTWIRLMESELPELKAEVFCICVKEGDGSQIVMEWKVEWIPSSLLWLVEFGRNWPNLKIIYFDILDKFAQEARFSWKVLGALFERAIFQSELRIPTAVIFGKTVLGFDSTIPQNRNGRGEITDEEMLYCFSKGETAGRDNDQNFQKIPKLISHTESLSLTPLFYKQQVKNRRIALDFQTFLDTRKPSYLDYNGWNDKVGATINFSKVPGMGMFDIDGLEENERTDVFVNVTSVLFLSTLVVLAFGIVNAFIYFPIMQQQQSYQELLNTY